MDLNNKIKIYAEICGNYPSTPNAIQEYPQNKYPVSMVIRLDSSNHEFAKTLKNKILQTHNSVNEIKMQDNTIPSLSYSFSLFFKNTHSMKPIFDLLKENDIYQRISPIEEKKITTFHLNEDARRTIGQYNIERG